MVATCRDDTDCGGAGNPCVATGRSVAENSSRYALKAVGYRWVAIQERVPDQLAFTQTTYTSNCWLVVVRFSSTTFQM